MNVHDSISQMIVQTRDVSLPHFAAELIICGTIVINLLVRMVRPLRWLDSSFLVLAGSLAALFAVRPWEMGSDVARIELFSGMLVHDGFGVLMRTLLLVFVVLFVIFTWLSGIPDKDDGPDIHTLVLGATLGMMLMCTANHLLMVFMSVEMASVPSYALAGLLKGRRQSSEAALKYSIYGAGTAGVMLYGISLISGLLNAVHLPTLAQNLVEKLPTMGPEETMVLALGGMMLAVGLAFKLSAVPFHFWCPDVFEGATAEVNAFLSVASKTAALALLVRVALGFGTTVPTMFSVAASTVPAATVPEGALATSLYSVADDASPNIAPANPAANAEFHEASARRVLSPVRGFIAKLIAFLAIITCTFGNLAAFGQTNIKRLFAYSTIAHAGYMMMAVPAILAAAGAGPNGHEVARQGAAALGVYLGVYLAMNLGAFAIIAFLRNAMRSEEIADYAGLIRRSPIVTICFVIILFSLVGLPPLAGFFGKFAVFSALSGAYNVTGQAQLPANYLVWLLVAGGLNTVISLFYYLRVVKVMTWNLEPRDQRPLQPIGLLRGAYVCLITLPTLGWILCFDLLANWCAKGAISLL
ncbi:MAG: NADH-quinone oxidoreductase subunit N [Planctomycetes bacterium]|nr:NADH-quinone oxidoreductase subunit N [Planctomycetota bacterium]